MAVKAPTAPTPPAAPTVPQVTLGGGGSVTETNAPPANGTRSTTGEAELENQARQSVADGNGALSKTVQTDPRAEKQQAAQAAQDTRQMGQDGARNAQQAGAQQAAQAARTTAPVVAAEPSNAQMMADEQPRQAQTQVSTQAQPDIPESFSAHGPLYWGVTLAAVFVVAFVILKTVMSRRGKAGELTKADLDDDGIEILEDRSLRGLTPDEVLARLEAEEKRERKEPLPTPAQAALRQAAAPPKMRKQPAPKATASAQGARQIAREYRTQAVAMPPEPKPKQAVPKPRPPAEDEQKHFEVRI